MGRTVQEARVYTRLRVMPGAAVRLPEPDWGQMGKLNICRPVLQPAVTVRQPGGQMDRRQGSSLERTQRAGPCTGSGGGG